MHRRQLLLGTLAGLTLPRAALGQQPKIPRVGYLFSFTPSSGKHLWNACRQGLRDLGYVEGHNIIVEPRWAEGDHGRLPALVADLLALKVDVIVSAATPASRAAKAAAGATPIVFVAVADPVRAGLVATLVRPGGNATGLTLLTPELSGKRLELLAQVAPVSRVALLTNPENLSHQVFLEETRLAAQTTRTDLHVLRARNAAEIDREFAAAAGGQASAMIVFDDPVLWSHRAQIVGHAARLRLPVMYGYREFVDEGGLMSYGPSRPDLYRRTALYVDKILKGTDPAGLPVERPTRFELVVNLKAAQASGLTVPPSVLLSADQLIE